MKFQRISTACLVAGALFMAGCHEKQNDEKISVPSAQSKQVEPPASQMHESEKRPVESSEVGSYTTPNTSVGSVAESDEPEAEADGVSYIPPIESGDSSTQSVVSQSSTEATPSTTNEQLDSTGNTSSASLPTVPNSQTTASAAGVQHIQAGK